MAKQGKLKKSPGLSDLFAISIGNPESIEQLHQKYH